MTRCYLCLSICLLAGCDVEDRKDALPPPVNQAESWNEAVSYSVGEISFSVPGTWQKGETNTPATRLFLFVPDGKGGASGMIKVDVGGPVEDDLAANAQAMESRFGGESTPILGGSVILTTTTSTSVQKPRYIFTTLIDGKVYFVFVASDSPDVADEACQSIQETFEIAAG